MTPWRALLRLWDAPDIIPADYPDCPEGFGDYLHALKVQHFSPHEVLSPHQPDKTSAKFLLPPQKWWDRGGACAVLADQLRTLVAAPIYLRNWYRPPEYNRAVGGKSASDHIEACAVDLDFQNNTHRRIALHSLETMWKARIFKMSLGTNREKGTTIHVGLWAPMTIKAGHQRNWHY